LLHAWAEGHVASRKIRQSFESESLNDRTAIIEVALQCFSGAPALRSGERKARDHQRKMPAQLDLLRSSEQTKELGFVAVQKAGFLCGNFFCRVGRAHSQNWIFAREARH
jgi:hypothetical protein